MDQSRNGERSVMVDTSSRLVSSVTQGEQKKLVSRARARMERFGQ
jgi:hypothetical protein